MRPDDAYLLTLESRVMQGVRPVITLANPGPGLDFSVAVPAGQTWRIVTLCATLTTSAAVANRFVGISYTVAGSLVMRAMSPVSLTAATTTVVCAAVGGAVGTGLGSANSSQVVLPPLWLEAGSVVSSVVAGRDVGDTITGVALLVEQAYLTEPNLIDGEGAVHSHSEIEENYRRANRAQASTHTQSPGG